MHLLANNILEKDWKLVKDMVMGGGVSKYFNIYFKIKFKLSVS
jgi:hypothetical protein